MATANTVFDDVAPWPERAAAPAPVGHNRPPVEEEARAEFREALLAERPEFETTLGNIIDAASRARADDEETYARCGSYIVTARRAKQHIEAAHKSAKERYLTGGRAVDAEKNAMLARLDEAASSVQAKMNRFAADKAAREKAERERIAAEQRAAQEEAARAEREAREAEEAARRAVAEATSAEEREAARRAAEEAARIAQEKIEAATLAPAVPTRSDPVRSDDGASVSTKTVWNSQVEDYAAAFRAVKTDPKVKEAVDAAIARRVRAGEREIKGVRIWSTQQAVAR